MLNERAVTLLHPFPPKSPPPNNAPMRQNHPIFPKDCENFGGFTQKDCENSGDFAEKDCEEMKIFPIFVPK